MKVIAIFTALNFLSAQTASVSCRPNEHVDENGNCISQRIDFDAANIDGDRVGPTIEYIKGRPSAKFDCDEHDDIDEWRKCFAEKNKALEQERVAKQIEKERARQEKIAAIKRKKDLIEFEKIQAKYLAEYQRQEKLAKKKAEKEERIQRALEAKQQKEAKRLALLEEKRLKKELLIARPQNQAIADSIVFNPTRQQEIDLESFCKEKQVECGRGILRLEQASGGRIVYFGPHWFEDGDPAYMFNVYAGSNIKSIKIGENTSACMLAPGLKRCEFILPWPPKNKPSIGRYVYITSNDNTIKTFIWLQPFCTDKDSADCGSYWRKANPAPVSITLQ